MVLLQAVLCANLVSNSLVHFHSNIVKAMVHWKKQVSFSIYSCKMSRVIARISLLC